MTLFHATLVVTALSSTLLSPTTLAEYSCNVNLSAGFSMDNNKLTFLEDSKQRDGEKSPQNTLYTITNGKTLTVRGNNIELTTAQKNLITQYDAEIRLLVPDVKNVAIEGVDLAIEGVNLAFNGLLGEGNSVGADLTKELELIREQVVNNLSIEDGINIGVEGLESDELLGKDFDQRIENAVEKAVLNSMGSILMSVGQQMMTSNSGEKNFEARMEDFGETIEQEMELRSAKIEQKAQALCRSMVEVDLLEKRLQTEIKQLADINVFTVKYSYNDDKQASVM